MNYWSKITSECREKSLCVRCRKIAAEVGKSKCEQCNKYQLEYMKKRKKKQVAEGVCTICGGPNDMQGIHECVNCSSRRTARNIENRTRRRILI